MKMVSMFSSANASLVLRAKYVERRPTSARAIHVSMVVDVHPTLTHTPANVPKATEAKIVKKTSITACPHLARMAAPASTRSMTTSATARPRSPASLVKSSLNQLVSAT